MSLGKSLATFRGGLAGKDLRGDCEGNLRGNITKTSQLVFAERLRQLLQTHIVVDLYSDSVVALQQVLPLVHSLTHLLQMAAWRLNWQMTRQNTAPVQMTIVFKFFCSVPSFNIFHHVSLEELPQKLQSLVPGHLRTKVVVASQEVMEVIHRLRSREAPVVAAEVCPVPPERHASSEKFNGFIPLQSRETRTDWQLGLSQSVCDTSFFYSLHILKMLVQNV